MLDMMKSEGTIEWLGTRYRIVLDAASGNGNLSIVDTWAPGGSGPPRHIHYDADEAFLVISGEIELWLEGESFRVGPGETAFVPRGSEHTFKVVSPGGCRKVVMLTPGGFEGFFAEMAAGQFAIPADMARIEEVAGRYRLAFTGPPL
jgi:quercetin dioxygenase-like cupin family protein